MKPAVQLEVKLIVDEGTINSCAPVHGTATTATTATTNSLYRCAGVLHLCGDEAWIGPVVPYVRYGASKCKNTRVLVARVRGLPVWITTSSLLSC